MLLVPAAYGVVQDNPLTPSSRTLRSVVPLNAHTSRCSRASRHSAYAGRVVVVSGSCSSRSSFATPAAAHSSSLSGQYAAAAAFVACVSSVARYGMRQCGNCCSAYGYEVSKAAHGHVGGAGVTYGHQRDICDIWSRWWCWCDIPTSLPPSMGVVGTPGCCQRPRHQDCGALLPALFALSRPHPPAPHSTHTCAHTHIHTSHLQKGFHQCSIMDVRPLDVVRCIDRGMVQCQVIHTKLGGTGQYSSSSNFHNPAYVGKRTCVV
jgi:hypothetical protein